MKNKGQHIDCELTIQKEAYSAKEGVYITATINNKSSTPIKILDWNTPLEGVRSDFVDIRLDEKEANRLPYQGIMVKRRAPEKSDYTTLPANGALTNSINILEGYSISNAGVYKMQLNFNLPYLDGNAEKSVQCKSNVHTVKITL